MKSTYFKLNSNPKKNNMKLLALAIAVILSAAGITGFLYMRHRNNTRSVIKTDDSAQTGSAKKDTIKQVKNEKNTANLPSNSTGLTSDEIPQSTESKISNVSFSQEGSTLASTATITGTNETGTCVFSFKSPEEKPVVKQVESTANSCNTTLSKFEFSKSGTWNLTVTRYQGDTKTEATREVTIN